MSRCQCSGDCSCVIRGAGDVEITGVGSVVNPYVITVTSVATDAIFAAAINNPVSATRVALDGVYAPVRRTMYVDQLTGNDANTGRSPGTSKATIQAAVDTLGANGGRVLVYEGTYAPFTVTTSGVEIESLGGLRSTIISTSSTTLSGVTFLGASAVSTVVQCKLKGFRISGPGKASGGTGHGLNVKWTSVDFTAEDCWFNSWGANGVNVEDAYSITFRDCLADQNGGDGFAGTTNFNNVTFDRCIAILNNGRGYSVVGGTTCLFLNADAESNVGAGFDLRYVFAATLLGCHMEKNGTNGTSPNIYLHYRTSAGEKTTATNIIGCLIQGQSVTVRGLVIDGASRTNLHGNWFNNHVTDHVQITANGDRTLIGANTYVGTGTELTDGSTSTARTDYDYTNLIPRVSPGLNFKPSTANPPVGAEGNVWWHTTLKQLRGHDGTNFRTFCSGVQGSATLDFGSIAADATAELTIGSLSGAVTGDSVILGPPAALESGLMASGRVTATGVVTIRVHNTTGSAIDPASATWKVTVVRA